MFLVLREVSYGAYLVWIRGCTQRLICCTALAGEARPKSCYELMYRLNAINFHMALKIKVKSEVAGMVGFEPTVHCTKNSCLTTWLHPNVWA